MYNFTLKVSLIFLQISDVLDEKIIELLACKLPNNPQNLFKNSIQPQLFTRIMNFAVRLNQYGPAFCAEKTQFYVFPNKPTNLIGRTKTNTSWAT